MRRAPNAQKAPVPLWSPWGAEQGGQHSPFARRLIALERLKRQKQARSLVKMPQRNASSAIGG